MHLAEEGLLECTLRSRFVRQFLRKKCEGGARWRTDAEEGGLDTKLGGLPSGRTCNLTKKQILQPDPVLLASSRDSISQLIVG